MHPQSAWGLGPRGWLERVMQVPTYSSGPFPAAPPQDPGPGLKGFALSIGPLGQQKGTPITRGKRGWVGLVSFFLFLKSVKGEY